MKSLILALCVLAPTNALADQTSEVFLKDFNSAQITYNVRAVPKFTYASYITDRELNMSYIEAVKITFAEFNTEEVQSSKNNLKILETFKSNVSKRLERYGYEYSQLEIKAIKPNNVAPSATPTPKSSSTYEVKGLLDDANVAEVTFNFYSERVCPVKTPGRASTPCEIASQGDLVKPIENAARLAMIGFNYETIVSKRKDYANALVLNLTEQLSKYGFVVKQAIIFDIKLKK